ncbi:CHAT domain-containing protein [Planctomycetota bacterium]
MTPYNIILVFPKQKFDQAETICLELSQKLQKKGQVPLLDQVWNEAEALQRCKDSPKHYDLMITSLDIPANRKIPLKSAEQRGIALIKSMRKNKIGIPCILLAEYKDEQLDAAIGKCKPCRVVETGVGNWESEFIIKCQASLLEKAEQDKHQDKPKEKVTRVIPETREENRGIVEIKLQIDKNRFEYSIVGKTLNINLKPLRIDPVKLDDLRNRSDNISFVPNWEKELHGIGYELYTQFSQSSDFEADMTDAINRCGGPENVRICFVLDKEVNPVVVEALLDRRDKYYMLCSPIYRTIPIDMLRTPLFKDSETRDNPINCLIIEADTSGTVLDIKDSQGKELKLEHLENVSVESKKIRKYLNKNKAEFTIGKIGYLTDSSRKKSYLDKLENTLKDGPWHIVHFAGHSYYDKANDTGYIFIPGPTGPEAVKAEEFALKLRKAYTRFLYLSSCKSSGADFVYELAEKQVPSVLGFRWDIKDDEAAEHATLFYENMFEGEKSLEYAFLRTRQQMHDRHKDQQIWCAAVLVIETKL